MTTSESQLEQLFKRSCRDTAAQAWLDQQLLKINDISEDFTMLDIALAMARRKVGTDYVECEGFNHWSCADLARVLLLKRAISVAGTHLISRAYSLGDEYEKEAILKGLTVLDREGECAALAVDACRTNMVSMMQAIALQNEYPMRFFSEHAYNQMVLKCLFMEINIAAVAGITERANAALSRMCYDYSQERLAANRDFPESLWLGMRLQDIQESRAFFLRYLNSNNNQHRYNVVQSLINSDADDAINKVLNTHLHSESDDRIRQLITGFI